MSDPAPTCSCRLPWLVALIALSILVIERVALSPSAAPATAAPPAPTADARLAALQHDLSETRRVLDDAQSALAQRDREIATANDELRILRQERDVLRAKAAPAMPAR